MLRYSCCQAQRCYVTHITELPGIQGYWLLVLPRFCYGMLNYWQCPDLHVFSGADMLKNLSYVRNMYSFIYPVYVQKSVHTLLLAGVQFFQMYTIFFSVAQMLYIQYCKMKLHLHATFVPEQKRYVITNHSQQLTAQEKMNYVFLL
jgi:hypothetical protein